MTAATKWDEPRYRRLANVEYRGGRLIGVFLDGSSFDLPADSLVPSGTVAPRWEALDYDEFEIRVPAQPREFEVPWSRIRALIDSEYSAYLAGFAAEQAKKIGERLRALRKARELTIDELARRSGITRQSLSRIESGKHDIVFTTLRRVLAAMGCSLDELASADEPLTADAVLERTTTAGLEPTFVLERILGREVDDAERTRDLLVRRLAPIYGWSNEDYRSSRPLSFDKTPVHEAMFKAQGRTNVPKAEAYAAYAHYICSLVAKSARAPKYRRPSRDAKAWRDAISESHGAVSLETLVASATASGILVVPLEDPGSFHGACWLIDDRAVVVLKQRTKYVGRWLFDLSHELGHVALHLGAKRPRIIDEDDISPFVQTEAEQEANTYAGDLIFAGRQEELAHECSQLTRGRLERLKGVLVGVAARAKVPADALANYLAYRLALEGEDWWATANTLQETHPEPSSTVREVLKAQLDLSRLSPDEQALLSFAIEIPT